MQTPRSGSRGRVLLVVLGGMTGVLLILVGLAVVPRILAHYFWPVERWYRGAPEQPIDFPHPSHVILGGIDCLFCHRTAATEAMASIPPVEQCMFCHKAIARDRPRILQLTEFAKSNQPIQWTRVHRLPDHVHFVHEAHITFFTRTQNVQPSQVCATCHGDVRSMQQVRQVRSLRMSDCVDCHRQYSAPTDCFVCHY